MELVEMKETTASQKALILASLALPFWIVSEIVVAVVVGNSETNEPIVASLTMFRGAVVVGNSVIARLIYQRKPIAAALTSLLVLAHFVYFAIDYSVMAGNALCSAGMGCGPSPVFLMLFLESYDKAYVGFFPYYFLWIIGFAISNRRRRRVLR